MPSTLACDTCSANTPDHDNVPAASRNTAVAARASFTDTFTTSRSVSPSCFATDSCIRTRAGECPANQPNASPNLGN
jgi:hypothetical protein